MEWILLFPLIPMICQDFKCRSVALWQLLLFGIMQISVCLFKYGVIQTGFNTLANLIILVIIGVSVMIYAHFRFKRKETIIGCGDIIFMLLLTPYFLYPHILHFLIVSLLIALICWWVGNYIRKKRMSNIPLVSYLGICFAIVVVYNSIDCL